MPVSIPKFTMEIDNVGGSFHEEEITNFVDYPMASGYTSHTDKMGFDANGVFTCTGWNSEMSNCLVTMHAVSTYVPP